MKAGGGKEKGNSFERIVCKELSLWVTNGSMAGVFTRNIISGGQFTNKVKADDTEHGMPGDIMARHPLAYDFLSKFLVECKFHKDLKLDSFIYDNRNSSSLAKIVHKCCKEAAHAKVRPMLVIKQNGRCPMVMLLHEEGEAALSAVPAKLELPFHLLHGKYWLFEFERFRRLVNARRMLDALKPL